ncbi:MAG: rubrerythrin family protein [Rhodospirillales bacterium]|nr:rubrerythrin family protein [Rhodospirillales bacterium]
MGQPINPAYPIAEVRSVDELMDIAAGMEHEAAGRYEELAAAMERAGDASLATLFRDLASLEKDHEQGLGRWAAREGRRVPLPRQFAWQMPETFGTGPEDGEVQVLTAYRALGIAVRNEERAFAFYTYLAALAEDDDVRKHAEALAKEELDHVAELRALRRRAFHAERGAPWRRPPVSSLSDLRRVSRGLEAGAAEVDAIAAELVAEAGADGAGPILRRLAEEDRGRAGASDQAGTASHVVEAARQAGTLSTSALTATGALRLALRNAEEILEIYMAIAEHAPDEDTMREAQRLGEMAVARLALIRSQLAEVAD